MPRKGKSNYPKKKEKMATGGVETSLQDGEDHGSLSRASEEDTLPVKDGEASDKGPTLNEILDSLSPLMGQIGKRVYSISGSTSYMERFLGLTAKV